MRYCLLLIAAKCVHSLQSPEIDVSFCESALREDPICLAIARGVERIDSAIHLFNRVSGYAIPSVGAIVLSPMDGMLLDAHLSMFCDSPSAETEQIISSLASTFSFNLLEAVFQRFVDQLHASVTDRVVHVHAEMEAKRLRRAEKKERLMREKEAARLDAEAATLRERNEASAMLEEEQLMKQIVRTEAEREAEARAVQAAQEKKEARKAAAAAREAKKLRAATERVRQRQQREAAYIAAQAREETARRDAQAARLNAAIASRQRTDAINRLEIEYGIAKGKLELDRGSVQMAGRSLSHLAKVLLDTATRLTARFAPLKRTMEQLRSSATDEVKPNADRDALQTPLLALVDSLASCSDDEVIRFRGAIVSSIVEMKRAGMNASETWAVCKPAYARMDRSPVVEKIEADIAKVTSAIQGIAQRMPENEAHEKAALERLNAAKANIVKQ